MDYFSSDKLRQGLKARAARGTVITAVAQGIVIAAQLLIIPLLTRLLDKSDFGLAAKVTALIGLAAMITDSGLSMATVQRPDLNHRQSTSLFWASLLIGVFTGLVVVACAPLVGGFYSDPRVVPICFLLAMSPPLQSLGAQHHALLTRGMQYGAIAAIQIVTLLLGATVCLAVAYVWETYWALFIRPVVEAATRTVLSWALCRWRPGSPRSGESIRDMMKFGVGLTGASLISYSTVNLDRILLARYFGDSATGVYERALRCFIGPLQRVQKPITSVVTGTLSRLSNEPERQRAAFVTIVSQTLCVTSPLVAAMMIQSEAVVLTVLGPDYGDAAPVFRWLSLAGFVQSVLVAMKWQMTYLGRGEVLASTALANGAIMMGAIVIGLPWGPVGVALGLSLSGIVLRLPVVLTMTTRAGITDPWDYIAAAQRATPITLVVAAANGIVLLTLGDQSPFVTCAAAAVVSFFAWFAVSPWTPIGPILGVLARKAAERLRRG